MLTAFIGGRVFVGDGSVFEHGAVLVEGERILKVSEGEIPVPKDARRIALDGRTLLPGFIDCHVHFCLDGSPDPVGTLVREHASLVTLKAAESARRTLLAGVTSVRDMGGKDGILILTRTSPTFSLPQGIEKVGLVLVRINALKQMVFTFRAFNLGIVAGCQIIRP